MPLFPAMKPGRLKITIVLCLAFAAALTTFGCRNFKVNNDKPVSGIVLPKSQMEIDSIAMRVAVVELDDQQKTDFDSFIETTDQKLPLEVRQRLDDNGIRVSVISSVNTPSLQKILAPGIPKREWLTGHELELAEAGKLEPVHRLVSHRHVEKKRGESFGVEVSSVRPSSSWRIHIGEKQLSDSAELAQCQMRITSWPQPDGSLKLQFLPEIRHGQKLSRIGVDGSTFAVQQSREVKELRSLSFEMSVLPGETVVVAPTEQLERIGDLFFNAKIAEVADPSEQDEALEEDNVDTSDFFPMLEQDDASSDVSVAVSDDLLEDTVLEAKKRRPQPWQRFLMVRVVEVTAPALP